VKLSQFLIALALPVLVAAAPGGELRIERVFGPEVPTGPYKHPAAIAAFDNGDLYLVYYGGKGEYANDTSVFGSRLRKGETQWSQPRVIAHDPLRSTGNGVVWQAPDGIVWLFYVVRFGDTWSESRIQVKQSTDRGETWSDASVLDLRAGMMVRCHPIVLAGGDYLLPIYHETGHDTEMVGPESASLFLRYSPKTGKWTSTAEVHSRIGNIQPAVAEIARDHLVAYCRRGGDYGPRKDGYLVRTESRDGGETWSPGVETSFPNPNSAVEFLKLKSGNLLLIYNDHMYNRTPLTAALSNDGDKSYPWRRNIVAGKNDFAYPSAVQTQDGLIHVVFTQDKRRVIEHAVFDEDWVREATGPRQSR
jgi:predicted neuraminidase